jgi:hypothetical protein
MNVYIYETKLSSTYHFDISLQSEAFEGLNHKSHWAR